MGESAEAHPTEFSYNEVKMQVAKLVPGTLKESPLQKNQTTPATIKHLLDKACRRADCGQTGEAHNARVAKLEKFAADADFNSRSLAEITSELSTMIKPAAVINKATDSIHAVAPRFGFGPWH